MRPTARIALSLAAALIAGCGGDAVQDTRINSATALGPHGGQALPLPDGKGYAEVLVETIGPKAPSRVLAVYFVGPDLKASLKPAPSNVGASVSSVEGKDTLSLSESPKAGDPAGASRFASPVGKFDADEYTGELTATIDGQPITKPFAIR